MSKQYITLSDKTMEEAFNYASVGDLVALFIVVYREFGYDLTSEDCPQFRAMDCEIPMEQWMHICSALQRGTNRFNVDRDPIAQVNYMLDWVNKGPSAHDSEEDQ